MPLTYHTITARVLSPDGVTPYEGDFRVQLSGSPVGYDQTGVFDGSRVWRTVGGVVPIVLPDSTQLGLDPDPLYVITFTPMGAKQPLRVYGPYSLTSDVTLDQIPVMNPRGADPTSPGTGTGGDHTHPQYLTATAGDTRYALKGEVPTGGSGTGGGVQMVNNDPGPEVEVTAWNLPGFGLTPPVFDAEGAIQVGGSRKGEYAGYDPVTNSYVNRGIVGSEHSHDKQYDPYDPNKRWALYGVWLDPGQAEPEDLPAGALVFESGNPSRSLIETVDTVLAAGPSRTIPPVTTAQQLDWTMSANLTSVTFPTAQPGTWFYLLVRQPASGGTFTWTLPSGIKIPNGMSATLSTAAGGEDLFRFVCIGGQGYRMEEHLQYGASAQPGPTPTVHNVFSANAGEANNLTSISATLPAALAAGDMAYMVVYGTKQTNELTTPTGWTLVRTDQTSTTIKTWLLRKAVGAADSGATVTAAFTNTATDPVTGQPIGATDRPGIAGIVVRGSSASGIVYNWTNDTTGDTALDVPTVTPEIGNSLLVGIAVTRFGNSGGVVLPQAPQVTDPAAGFTQRLKFTEGRDYTASINLGGYIQTKALTGQANTPQTAGTATYSSNGTDSSYIIAVPPPVA